MIGLILAGGNCVRIINDIPYASKVLIPVNGKTLIQHNIDYLSKYVDEIIVVVGESWKPITEEIASRPQKVPIIIHDKEGAKSPFDAMVNMAKYINDNVFMALGDSLLVNPDIKGFIKATKDTDVLLGYIPDRPYDEISTSYSLEYNEDGTVKALFEKPKTAINHDKGVGYYYMSREVYKMLPDVAGKEIIDLFLYAISKGYSARSYKIADMEYNVNTIQVLNAVEQDLDRIA